MPVPSVEMQQLARAFFAEAQEQLRQTIEDWQATAEVDAEPKVAYYLKLPREKKEYKAWEGIRVTL